MSELEEKNKIKIFKEDWILPATSCCRSMGDAMRWGLVVIHNDEFFINIAVIPQKAGNVLTGEIYNPENFVMCPAIEFCPFCSKKLSEYSW